MEMPDPAKLISGFLQTERLPSGKRRLIRDLIVEVEGKPFTIPKDTRTDFSSIPAIGRMFVRWSKVDIAGVVHDWLYENGEPNGDRREADRIWRLVAVSGQHHANAFQAWGCWFFLRLFGGFAWNRHRRRLQ
jgi:hypothetical protein